MTEVCWRFSSPSGLFFLFSLPFPPLFFFFQKGRNGSVQRRQAADARVRSFFSLPSSLSFSPLNDDGEREEKDPGKAPPFFLPLSPPLSSFTGNWGDV